MRVLVCGGRKFSNEALVYEWLNRIAPTRVITGGCSGADELAIRWANDNGVARSTFYADWKKHGKKAGPLRNAEMLTAEPDMVLAFPGGHGTADMIRKAKAAGVPVMEILR